MTIDQIYQIHTYVHAVHSVQLYVLRTNDYEYEQVDVFVTCFSGTPNINIMFVLDARGEPIMSHAMVSRQPMMVKSDTRGVRCGALADTCMHRDVPHVVS